MKGRELRERFIDYFKGRGHKHVPSAPLIPPDDPTMLFTSAGMVQFKPLWGGEVEPLPYRRACTVQKCLRAGGKGSDLENVGRTLRHHTFFEMLGNFSFGDYFKAEAISWAWEFVTQVMKLPPERLWVSTFVEDAQAAEIWEKEQGIPRSRIIPLDDKENFWGPAGETGACGPCSEILFFMGSEEQLSEADKQDVATIARRVVEEGDLFLEIWNMVFPQYDQKRDGSRTALKYRGIDTGAGLERMTTAACFIETGGKIGSPYETDLLWEIITAAAEITGLEYVRRFDPVGKRNTQQVKQTRLGLNAVADHVRALVFALSEGIMPSNEGRGYVLRRIQRRALRFAHLLGVNEPFLYKLVDAVIHIMGDAWPEIKGHPDHVKKVIRLEEENFLKTLRQGESILSELIEKVRDKGREVIPGEEVFKLHDTYGFPVDLTDEVVRDAGLRIDRAGYDQAMKHHKEEAGKSWKGADLETETELLSDVFDEYGPTIFLRESEGHKPVTQCQSNILAIIKNNALIQEARQGEAVTLILKETCFYGKSGGQIGDTGVISIDEPDREAEVNVTDTLKTPSGLHLHVGEVTKGKLCVGDQVTATIDAERRFAIMRNHTATHLLQKALRKVVGKHIRQQGSSVTEEGFRFDFTNPEPLTPDQLDQLERLVQRDILRDTEITTREMEREQARDLGAIAPFGEKYGSEVRVVGMDNDRSLEFCGGTHCSRTGEIGSMVIDGESSIASGVRRIVARTGNRAFEEEARARRIVSDLAGLLSTTPDELVPRVEKMAGEIKDLQKEIQKLRREKAAGSAGDMTDSIREAGGVRFITRQTEGMDVNELRNLADTLRARIKDGVVVIGNTDGEKVNLVCTVSGKAGERVSAVKLVREMAKIVEGGGGGRDDMAQAGGKRPDKLPQALNAVENILKRGQTW